MGGTFLESFCVESRPPEAELVIFGATGDLATRKLFPALLSLFSRSLLPQNCRIVGCSRKQLSQIEFAEFLQDKLSGSCCPELLARFLPLVEFRQCDYTQAAAYPALLAALGPSPRPRLYYLALPQKLYWQVIRNLSLAGGFQAPAAPAWRHVVLEKPFGYDPTSAAEINALLLKNLKEEQIYRIDHYLGKDTVQNILLLRFANIIFEPVWNRQYIDHVELTVAEADGIGERAGYYESAGALRDMFQNHLLLLLTLVAMETPNSFGAGDLQNELFKTIRAIRPFTEQSCAQNVVRAQYRAGNNLPGYREERGVPPDSLNETYVATKLWIDSWRWSEVPFYLRSGKRLSKRKSVVKIYFRNIPYSIFAPVLPRDLSGDVLSLNIQPDDGFGLTIQAKKPGPKLCMGFLSLDFNYASLNFQRPFDAYERLLLDALSGDQSLFMSSAVIEASWQLWAPVLAYWQKHDDLAFYEAGSAGPERADQLLLRDHREWSEL